MNSGVMYMNVKSMHAEWPKMLEYGVEKAFGFMSYDQGFLESYYRGPAYTEPPKKEGDKPKNKPGKPLWDTCGRRPPR